MKPLAELAELYKRINRHAFTPDELEFGEMVAISADTEYCGRFWLAGYRAAERATVASNEDMERLADAVRYRLLALGHICGGVITTVPTEHELEVRTDILEVLTEASIAPLAPATIEAQEQIDAAVKLAGDYREAMEVAERAYCVCVCTADIGGFACHISPAAHPDLTHLYPDHPHDFTCAHTILRAALAGQKETT